MSGLRPELSALMHFVDYPGPASLTVHPLWCLWCLRGVVISGASVWKYLALGGSLCTDGSRGRERTMPPQGWPWIGSPSMTTAPHRPETRWNTLARDDLDGLMGFARLPPLNQAISKQLSSRKNGVEGFEKTPSKPGNMTEFIGERGGRKRNNIAWATGIACFTLLYRLTASCLLLLAAACCPSATDY